MFSSPANHSVAIQAITLNNFFKFHSKLLSVNSSNLNVNGKILFEKMGFSRAYCKTITFDQGSKFADHRQIEQGVGCKIYYCEPRSPWQKGSNENMNGRLRRYLPRHTQLDQITQKELDRLAERMNTLPRKCLDFRTPKELFLKHIKKICRTRM